MNELKMKDVCILPIQWIIANAQRVGRYRVLAIKDLCKSGLSRCNVIRTIHMDFGWPYYPRFGKAYIYLTESRGLVVGGMWNATNEAPTSERIIVSSSAKSTPFARYIYPQSDLSRMIRDMQ